MAETNNSLRARLEYAAARLLIASLRRAPLPIANALARFSTCLLDLVLPKLRRVATINLSFAFPELNGRERNRLIDGVFRSIARLLVGLARFPSLNSRSISHWITYEGLQHYLTAKQSGKGVLIATAHLGNWELSAFAHALMTEPMDVMVRPLDNPLIDRFVQKRRTLSGNRLIDKRDAARAVIKALRNNEAVGILADQNTSPSEGVFVNFFGKPACASSAFVKFAYHSGAPIIIGFALWHEPQKRYVLRFYPPIELSGDIEADTQRLHSFFEEIIRRYPDQWMWIHRRWKTRPTGEASLY